MVYAPSRLPAARLQTMLLTELTAASKNCAGSRRIIMREINPLFAV